MNLDLDSLEGKIDRVLALCRGLTAENRAMRERIAELESDRRNLTHKVDQARERLEALISRLPQA